MRRGPTGEIRITGGSLRGRRLRVPAGLQVRPTQERVREAVFSSVAARLPGARVLDLFAGTGAFGFEAWSRGAGEVWWVEQDRGLAEAIRGHAQSLCVEGGATRCVHSDVFGFLENPPAGGTEFDLVFADPPYAQGGEALEKTLLLLRARPILRASGVLVFEQAAGGAAEPPPGWRLLRDRRYGATRILQLAVEP